MNFRVFLAPFVALCVLALDQISKAWVLSLSFVSKEIIPGCFNLTFVTNSGSVWGIGTQYTQYLAVLGVLASLLLFFFMLKISSLQDKLLCACLLGGILGNTIDRFTQGYVVDFLDFYIKTWHWPCFNIADIAITSVCLLFFFRKSKA